MRGFNEYSGNFFSSTQSWLGSRGEKFRKNPKREAVSNADVSRQRTLTIGTCKHCGASLFLFLVAFNHDHNEQ
jgi:hypothetical protein